MTAVQAAVDGRYLILRKKIISGRLSLRNAKRILRQSLEDAVAKQNLVLDPPEEVDG